jgi:hypothetical protein
MAQQTLDCVEVGPVSQHPRCRRVPQQVGMEPGDARALGQAHEIRLHGRGIDSGHFLAEEAPDEVYQELSKFFKS